MRFSAIVVVALVVGAVGSGAVAVAHRPAVRSRAAAPAPAGAIHEPARLATSVAVATRSAPAPAQAPSARSGTSSAEQALQQLNPEVSEEPSIDLAWEQRLAAKLPTVARFFAQTTASYEEWMRAYRDDICACQSRDCAVALQDDFIAHAPRVTDRAHTPASDEAMKTLSACLAAFGSAAP